MNLLRSGHLNLTTRTGPRHPAPVLPLEYISSGAIPPPLSASMKLRQVAAQLYTVREHCQTATDLATSLRRIRQIGYQAVQLSGLGPIPEAEIVTMTGDLGLTICATHEGSHDILDRPEKAIARLQALGCKNTAYPFPKDINFGQPEEVRTLVRKLEASGAKFRAAGLTLAYHNHAIEFVKFEGSTVLNYIYQKTAPEHLAAELDTYWIQLGGGNPVDWCRKLRGRLPFIHLKDYTYTTADKPGWCEIGSGTLPFAEIIAEAESGGCEWFIVEQDTCPGDPFESLKKSYDYLWTHLATA